jgi:hypothetical protein
MRIKGACVSALFVVSLSSLGAAGPIVDAATRAEALHAEGKTVEAIEALDEALDTIWREAPLAFRKAVVVNSSSGQGVYDERTNLTYRPDEKMMIYVEPIGFGYRDTGASSTIGFSADLAIENTTGQVLGEAKDLFSLSTPSRVKTREFGMTLSFGVPYLRPGEYKAIVTVDDQNSPKTGTFEVMFNIGLPAADSEGAAAPN